MYNITIVNEEFREQCVLAKIDQKMLIISLDHHADQIMFSVKLIICNTLSQGEL